MMRVAIKLFWVCAGLTYAFDAYRIACHGYMPPQLVMSLAFTLSAMTLFQNAVED